MVYSNFPKSDIFSERVVMNSNYIPIQNKLEFKKVILSHYKESEKIFGVELYPPDFEDLYSLYLKTRQKKIVAILELGSGWSTLALALALEENRISHSDFVLSAIRHPNPFALMTVDVSPEYSSKAISRLSQLNLKIDVIPIVSSAYMSNVNGQICHLYKNIPPFTADLIYLDGPDCDQVEGNVNGMTVNFGSDNYRYGLPMSGDLISLEPFFWPGTNLVVDGRGANARFLKNNFLRNWIYEYNKEVDQHHFLLDEEPFGKISEMLLNYKIE